MIQLTERPRAAGSAVRRGASTLAGATLLLWAAAASAAPVGGYADLVEKVAPAVVNVFTTQPAKVAEARPSPFGPGSPFEEFAKRFGIPMPPPGPQGRPSQALGSGFVIDAEGYVVTNNHVIAGASEIRVRMADQSEFTAMLVGSDPETDLALLKVDAPTPLPAVSFGDSSTLRVGDEVVAVGNPFGLGGSVTAGIVSARGRSIDGGPYVDFIQIDAAINRGNSGGPLFDTAGRVVGVNSAILSPSGGSVGVGFAIPSDLARSVIAQLREGGRVERGWLGVSIQPVTPEIAQALGLDDGSGALVTDVVAGGPSAGRLRAGDLIRSVDGTPVASARALPQIIAGTRIGETARIGVLRGGESLEVPVEIGRREARAAEATSPNPAAAPEGTAFARLGVTVAPVTDEVRSSLGLGDGVDGVVVTSVKSDGAAANSGITAGDVIQQIDGRAVAVPGDVARAIDEAKSPSVLALVLRGGTPLFVGIRLAGA
jgi:serine protease Do